MQQNPPSPILTDEELQIFLKELETFSFETESTAQKKSNSPTFSPYWEKSFFFLGTFLLFLSVLAGGFYMGWVSKPLSSPDKNIKELFIEIDQLHEKLDLLLEQNTIRPPLIESPPEEIIEILQDPSEPPFGQMS